MHIEDKLKEVVRQFALGKAGENRCMFFCFMQQISKCTGEATHEQNNGEGCIFCL